MGKFRTHDPEEAWLLPPSVEYVLGADHLSFFVHEIVERLDLRAIEDSYSDEGQPAYHPRLLLKLWLNAYCLGITSSRRLEQRTREDLGFRFLAGGSTPDHWTTECIPAPGCQSVERSVHPGSGVCQGAGLGTAGSRGRRFDSDRGECFARSYRYRGEAEESASRHPTADPAMAEAMQ